MTRSRPGMAEKIALVNLGANRFDGLSAVELKALMQSDCDRLIFAGDLYPSAQENVRILRLYGFEVEIVGRVLEDDSAARYPLEDSEATG